MRVTISEKTGRATTRMAVTWDPERDKEILDLLEKAGDGCAADLVRTLVRMGYTLAAATDVVGNVSKCGKEQND